MQALSMAVGLHPSHKALPGKQQAYPIYLAGFLIICGIAQYLGETAP